MKYFLTYIPVLIAFVVYTDGSSECPSSGLQLHCGSQFMSLYLSTCQRDDQCTQGSKCCTIIWCIKRCTRLSMAAPLRSVNTCTSPSDCPASHCCVNRQPGATSGVCQKMGSMSADCYVSDPYTATPPAGVVQTCPCGFGNYCARIPGKSDQLGEMGHCRSF
ncbi:uncharacterized protein LOC121371460 isoform X1 [Gigantopelta aegis]|uniref:uncharacterized protein LOC121371460 isoform X1 n=1 Tax=Gigantopelta aegis TaxID=1735272 RepID=UPI001B88A3A9|nr:uncharacterized protein LOC121371460 isoform X1 [Gigantopelta aegis]